MNYFLFYILLDLINNKDIDFNGKNNNNMWMYNKNDVVIEKAPTKLKNILILFAGLFVTVTVALSVFFCR